MLALLTSLALAAAPGATWLGPKPPARPARVATVAPSLTELVLALGAQERLVGVSRFDDAPEVAGLPRLGGLVDPSPEAILAVKPDLLIVQPSPAIESTMQRLAQLGVPVLEVSLGSIAEIEVAEREVGAALGRKAQGDALADALESGLAQARARAQRGPHPRVLMVYGWSPLVVAGPGSFADELLRAAGGINAASAAKSNFVTYSVESAAAARPDLLLDLTYDEKMPQALATLPGLAQAKLVRPKSLAMLHPGPKLVTALHELEDALRSAK